MILQAPEWYREAAVGAALSNSRVDRASIFLTSKLHPRHHGYNSALQQVDKVQLAGCRSLPLVMDALTAPLAWLHVEQISAPGDACPPCSLWSTWGPST
jgi:hypothetical protein